MRNLDLLHKENEKDFKVFFTVSGLDILPHPSGRYLVPKSEYFVKEKDWNYLAIEYSKLPSILKKVKITKKVMGKDPAYSVSRGNRYMEVSEILKKFKENGSCPKHTDVEVLIDKYISEFANVDEVLRYSFHQLNDAPSKAFGHHMKSEFYEFPPHVDYSSDEEGGQD